MKVFDDFDVRQYEVGIAVRDVQEMDCEIISRRLPTITLQSTILIGTAG